MQLSSWILILEPNQSDREIVAEELDDCMVPASDQHYVDSPSEMAKHIANEGALPSVMVLDWAKAEEGLVSFLDTLNQLALLERVNVIAVARDGARQALCDARMLGLKRFVSKHPDEASYRRKLADALRECLGLPALADIVSLHRRFGERAA